MIDVDGIVRGEGIATANTKESKYIKSNGFSVQNVVLKMCKKNDNDETNPATNDILKKLDNVNIEEEEQRRITQILEYEYKNKDSTVIPTKTSVTEIKEMTKKGPSPNSRRKGPSPNLPKFLQTDEEIKITNAEKGTLIHLCMQKLDLTKSTYTFNDVKEMVAQLEAKKIITPKEAEAININKVYQFTKSKIWNEMIQAKEVQREKPFYINIPAKEIYNNEKIDEKLLVQGIIDLYYITQNDELILVDFKTDYVEDRNEQYLIEKYKIQLELYKRALESATNRKVNKMYIYSTYLEKEIDIG